MNYEYLSSVRIEVEQQPLPLDFATIRNPIGPSRRLAANIEARNQVTERELCADIASWLGIDPSRIALGNGSDELIQTLPDVVMKPGDRCVIPIPTYFGLTDSLTAHGNGIIAVPADAKERFVFTDRYVQQIINTINAVHPALVWLCSPNNPTGTPFTPAQIDAITSHTPGLVIVDEAYQEILDPRNEQSAVRLLSRHDNLLVTKTFSKAFALPAIRVGIAIGNSDLIQILEKRPGKQPISDTSLVTAAAALLDSDHLKETQHVIRGECIYLAQNIADLAHIELGAPTQTGVAILRHPERNLHQLLLAQGIQTGDWNAMPGLRGMGFVRVGLQTHETNTILVAALRRCDF